MKKCTKCGEIKETNLFCKNKRKDDGLSSVCRSCSHIESSINYQKRKEKNKLPIINIDYGCKKCSKCGEIKELSDFYKNKSKKDGFCSSCKSCSNKTNNEYFIKNKDKIKISRKNNYNDNKVDILAKKKVNRDNNKEKIAKQKKESNIKNKTKRAALGKIHRKLNKEKISLASKNRYQLNKKEIREKQKKNRTKNAEKIKIQKKNAYDKNAKLICKNQYKKKKERLKNDPFFKFKHDISCLIRISFGTGKWSKNTKTQQILGCSYEELFAHLKQTFFANYDREINENDKLHIDHIIPVSSTKTEEEFLKLNHFSNLQYLLATDNLKKSNKLNFILNRK